MSAEIEKLSSEFHDIYMKEAHKQGRVLHPDKYEDLEENVKEYDRVLARYFVEKINLAKKEAAKEIVQMIQPRFKDSNLDWLECYWYLCEEIIEKFHLKNEIKLVWPTND